MLGLVVAFLLGVLVTLLVVALGALKWLYAHSTPASSEVRRGFDGFVQSQLPQVR